MSLVERLAARLALTDTTPPRDDARRAAVAAIIDSDDRVLLMRRTERTSDPWSGHVSLPGGRYEATDRDLLATAIRETREELDVDLLAERTLGNLPALHPLNSGGKHGIEVTPFVFASRGPLAPRVSAEAAAVFWLPLAAASTGVYDRPYIYEPAKLQLPSWVYETHTIWGLTHRILRMVLDAAG